MKKNKINLNKNKKKFYRNWKKTEILISSYILSISDYLYNWEPKCN